MGWSTVEKEAYAVLASVERSHWLSACPAVFDLYTDHNYLLFIFDPTTIIPDIGKVHCEKCSAGPFACRHTTMYAYIYAA